MHFEPLQGPVKPGQYIDLTYYAKGGMGEIYLAKDSVNGHDVAIKILFVNDMHELKLLKSESEIALQLNHPNIIRTYYAGEGEINGKMFFYIVMYYAKSGNFSKLFDGQKELLSIGDATRFMLDIARGLSEAHKLIIHRDLKPLNILVGDDGRLMICDFGLARLVDAQTRSNSFKGSGTLLYMSPECFISGANSILMDIYSLGIIFFQILTFKVPYNGSSWEELRSKHLFDSLPKILDIRKDVPVKLVEIIEKMTSKKPQDRYSSVLEVIKALETIHINEKITVPNNEILIEANKAISIKSQQALEESKRLEVEAEFRKLRGHMQIQLLQGYKEVIDNLNTSLEREKIIYKFVSPTIMSITFMNRKVDIHFFGEIPIQNAREHYAGNARRAYGGVMSPVGTVGGFLEKDGVLCIGRAGIAQDYGRSFERVWSYNLLWKRISDEDIYGYWDTVWFEDTLNAGHFHQHYAMNIPEFYREYEIGRERVIHNKAMHMRHHGVDDINELLKILVIRR
jgi:serine/threonine protein kinase